MESSIKSLSLYRFQRAEDMLKAAEENLIIEQYNTSLNRSYYAVFHAMRAVNITERFDSSRHSGVIAYFNQYFLKTGKLDKNLSKIIKETSYLREKSDYDDFYITNKNEVKEQLENAKIFVEAVRQYLGL